MVDDEDALILCEQAEALIPATTPAEDDLNKEVHNDLKKLLLSCWVPNVGVQKNKAISVSD